MPHPTQIYLSNPQALRVAYTLDDASLALWWSPLAGRSTDWRDRNFSHRDAHLDIFREIHLPGCELGRFRGCVYDPYHSILEFENQRIHLAVPTDLAAVFIWSENPQSVELASHRHDQAAQQTPQSLVLAHSEPRYAIEFAAILAPGTGTLRHSPVHAPEHPYFNQVTLAPGQLLAIGAGLVGEEIAAKLEERLAEGPDAILAGIETTLAPHLASGRIQSKRFPELVALREMVIRGLHSMIDESGAFRASLKAIYYLIWVRDGGFSFPCHAAAGWPHKLPELCRFLLDNPLQVDAPGLPPGRMFGQLVNRTYGKMEEDGIYYIVRVVFTLWTQSGRFDGIRHEDWALIDEVLDWVDAATWDANRGRYGTRFADETPVAGSRDYKWDYAIGKPVDGSDVLTWDGTSVTRNYDVYFNILMHSTYTMLAAMRPDAYQKYSDKAQRVWPCLQALIQQRNAGIPLYAEQLLTSGQRVTVPHWGQVTSCCVWGLVLPNFLPLDDWESVLDATMDAILEKPDMHWINGICGALAAIDTWFYDEEKLLAMHLRVGEETNRAGKYLPMGGAMPEKFGAPEGDLHHDIRPQGFSMGAWIAAWTSLGLRRLPYGLALRSTQAFERLENYPWRDAELNVSWHAGRNDPPLMEIDGARIPGTLQIPQDAIREPVRHHLRLLAGDRTPLWLASSVQLDSVQESNGRRTYHFIAFGLASITFNEALHHPELRPGTRQPLEARWVDRGRSVICFFEHRGAASLAIDV